MRPLSRPYLQHGRRHAPGGTDPIPQVGGVPMIMANGSGAGLTGANNYIDLSAYLTTDPSIYSLQFGTGGLSATHGVAIAEDGVYQLWMTFRFTSATNGDVLEGSYDGGAGPNLFWLMSNNQRDTEIEVVYDTTTTPAQTTYVAWTRMFVIGGSLEPGPVAALPRFVFAQTANQTSIVRTYNVGVWVYIERLGTSYVTNSFTPF